MKVVILAGGLGTRLAEETSVRPKPMVEIGGHPILWHIIKSYSTHGINDVVVCLGYRGFSIKEYFASYSLRTSNVTFNLASNEVVVHRQRTEPWRVTLVDTGEDTMTGGRLRRVREYLDPTETFCFTYGDGVSNVDISQPSSVPQTAGQTRHSDSRAAAGSLRSDFPQAGAGDCRSFSREACRRRCVDQWRIFCT